LDTFAYRSVVLILVCPSRSWILVSGVAKMYQIGRFENARQK
jgi:hypothetical protein